MFIGCALNVVLKTPWRRSVGTPYSAERGVSLLRSFFKKHRFSFHFMSWGTRKGNSVIAMARATPKMMEALARRSYLACFKNSGRFMIQLKHAYGARESGRARLIDKEADSWPIRGANQFEHTLKLGFRNKARLLGPDPWKAVQIDACQKRRALYIQQHASGATKWCGNARIGLGVAGEENFGILQILGEEPTSARTMCRSTWTVFTPFHACSIAKMLYDLLRPVSRPTYYGDLHDGVELAFAVGYSVRMKPGVLPGILALKIIIDINTFLSMDTNVWYRTVGLCGKLKRDGELDQLQVQRVRELYQTRKALKDRPFLEACTDKLTLKCAKFNSEVRKFLEEVERQTELRIADWKQEHKSEVKLRELGEDSKEELPSCLDEVNTAEAMV
ncbi:hypothetical protein B0H17DRAFT_1264418 [Mycena rosella]|uniref:Uncharacterized protein n=1 Tax=Mycena rosella TaxID=1033263 RepID=A0AAD7H041_MYCRO|nr:hypothetical protein B0H17DRAFT_1264418 [Mycena rosella]